MDWPVRAVLAGGITVLIALPLAAVRDNFLRFTSLSETLFLLFRVFLFLVVYDWLDARFGSELLCKSCTRTIQTRRITRCPHCRAPVGIRFLETPLRKSVFVISMFLLWGVFPGEDICYYSAKAWYLFIGQGAIGLDCGPHYGSGFGFRPWIPAFDYDAFYFWLPREIPLIIGCILAWRGTSVWVGSLWKKPDPRFCPCGYDLTGNTSGICPECGGPVNTPEREPPSTP